MTVYAVALSKGGSTKTTTAAEVVASLARAGRRVLAIDLNEQGNLTTRLGVSDETEVAAVAADVLTADDAAVPAPSVPGADVLAGTHDLADLNQRPEVITSLRDHLLDRDVVDMLNEQYPGRVSSPSATPSPRKTRTPTESPSASTHPAPGSRRTTTTLSPPSSACPLQNAAPRRPRSHDTSAHID